MSNKVFKMIIIVVSTIMISYMVYDIYNENERIDRYNEILARFFQAKENGCIKSRDCFYRPSHDVCGFKFYNNNFYSDTIEYIIFFYSDTIEYIIFFYSLENRVGTSNLIDVRDSLIWLKEPDRVKIIKSTGEEYYMGIDLDINFTSLPMGLWFE